MRISFTDKEGARIVEIISQSVAELGLDAYLVGGFLRDALLKIDCKDIDILVMDQAQALAQYLHTNKGFYSPILFKTFGTYRTFYEGWEIEIVPPRAKTLKEDLLLRDFTINTLTARLGKEFIGGSTIDAEDGLGTAVKDLDKKIVRTPINPEKSIADDPIRALRAVRFSCSLNFSIDEGLSNAIRSSSRLLKDAAVERIRDELVRSILLAPPSRCLKLMHDLGLLGAIAPELLPAVGHKQKSPYHYQDVFDHCLSVMDACEPELVLRLSALFHDIGKTESEAVVDGRYVYYGHQKVSSEKARSFLDRLRFSKEVRDSVMKLVENHMVCYTEEWKDSTVKRFMRKMGPLWDRLMLLLKADASSLRPEVHTHLKNYEELLRRAESIRINEVQSLISPLNGNEIRELLGIPPGPLVGEIKEKIVSAIMDGHIPNTKEAARDWVRNAFLKKWQRGGGGQGSVAAKHCKGRGRPIQGGK